jgi:FkbM family methyltransferase
MPTIEHVEAIRGLSPKTLIDVGANKGQFSVMARELFPDLEILAFEPLGAESKQLTKVVRQPMTLYRTALGRARGTATFFVASRADSSSLLEPNGKQLAVYQVSKKEEIRVPVAQLTEVIDLARLRRPILLKIDVQGAELEVLKGAESQLSLIDAIYCEVSFVELYNGQPLADEITSYLSAHGFSLRGVFNQSVTDKFGPTQADFLFSRNGVPPSDNADA